ncbi:hypothetical protein SUGI_0091710, partial [Cryptomeria japonica]
MNWSHRQNHSVNHIETNHVEICKALSFFSPLDVSTKEQRTPHCPLYKSVIV